MTRPQSTQNPTRKQVIAILSSLQVSQIDDHAEDLIEKAADRVLKLVDEIVWEKLKKAEAKPRLRCKYGHQIIAHRTVDGWCCACDTDQAFMRGEVEDRTREVAAKALSQFKAEHFSGDIDHAAYDWIVVALDKSIEQIKSQGEQNDK